MIKIISSPVPRLSRGGELGFFLLRG